MPADAPSPVAALRESAERAPESPSSIAATLRPLAERATAALDAAASAYLRGEPSDALNAANSQAQGRLLAACSPERVLALCEAVERYEAALRDITDPFKKLRRDAEAIGARLNGHAADVATSPSFLQQIARDALAATPTPEPTDGE